MALSAAQCERVLRTDDRGRYTVPSPKLYPHQWAWDSAFAAIGWAHIDPARAWVELQTLMEAQWDDGRVPHITFHDRSQEYFPGPDFWGTTRTSSISQPPVWATATRRVLEIAQSGDASRGGEVVRTLLAPMDASHAFFHRHRDPLGWNVIAVVHPWESGLDNAPMWDGPLSRIDVSNPPPFRRRDTTVVTDASQRPTHEQYLRYAVLVKNIIDDGFGPGSFAVYDPAFTAILIRAEDDLAWLGQRFGVETRAAERAASLRAGLERHLWDAQLGRYLYVDVPTRERITADVVGGYLPLWCGVPEPNAQRLRAGLRERFATPWSLPSTAPSDPGFDPRRYWRGPVWVNVNWMLSEALGASFVEQTLALIERTGFFEYFEPYTGEGLGGDEFAWTAALALDLLRRSEYGL